MSATSRMDEQRLADTEELEHPRDHEHLQQEAEQVDRAEQTAVGLADETFTRRPPTPRPVPNMCVRLLDDVAAEEVFARRVHDVEQDREQRQ